MALSDLTATVVVGKGEYESLVRKSEQLEIIKLLVENVVVNVDTIRAILGVEKAGEPEPWPDIPKHVNCRCSIHGLTEEDFNKIFFGKESEE